VNHSTETIATHDTRLPSFGRRQQRRTCRAGRRQGQRSMWSVSVVMVQEDVENAFKMLVVQDQQPVRLELAILAPNSGLGNVARRQRSDLR